jgi:hypothetical protein
MKKHLIRSISGTLDHAFQSRPAVRVIGREAPPHFDQVIADRFSVLFKEFLYSCDRLFGNSLADVAFVELLREFPWLQLVESLDRLGRHADAYKFPVQLAADLGGAGVEGCDNAGDLDLCLIEAADMSPVPDPLDGGLNDGLRLPICEIFEFVAGGFSELLKLVARLAAEECGTVLEILIDEKLPHRLAGIVREFAEVEMVELADELDRFAIGTSELQPDRGAVAAERRNVPEPVIFVDRPGRATDKLLRSLARPAVRETVFESFENAAGEIFAVGEIVVSPLA